jgi:hypothetical protein
VTRARPGIFKFEVPSRCRDAIAQIRRHRVNDTRHRVVGKVSAFQPGTSRGKDGDLEAFHRQGRRRNRGRSTDPVAVHELRDDQVTALPAHSMAMPAQRLLSLYAPTRTLSSIPSLWTDWKHRQTHHVGGVSVLLARADAGGPRPVAYARASSADWFARSHAVVGPTSRPRTAVIAASA